MASVSDEEIAIQEEKGRRTRSGRKAVPTTPQRSTRRSSRKQTQEQTNEIDTIIEEEKLSAIDYETKYKQSGIIEEMLAEAAQGVIIDHTETFIDNSEGIQETEILETVIECNEPDMIVPIQEGEEQIIIQEQIIQQEDEKSSSFPFGNVPASENSDGKTDENMVTNLSDCVDSSLLASLVGDNANSLPSVGEESQSKEQFEVIESNEMNLEDKDMVEIVNEDSVSQPAVAEDLQNGSESEKTVADTEMIYEEEIVTKNVQENEENSVDIPESVEVAEVLIDESIKKDISKRKASDEGYDPDSPTEESIEIPEKKTKIEHEVKDKEETKDKKREKEKEKDKIKEKEKEKEKEKKKLPELEKFWKDVNEDPTNFTGWTYLLQYVDQENDIEAARDAYNAFLSHYPYCYGYWRKYADYEKRKGNKKMCEEVFEKGLKAIPLSVDLWIHYLTHVKTNYTDNEEYIRSQFERALTACGLEFRSDKLWEAFIKWETDAKRYSHVIKIYDRLLATPTQGYNGHFESFQDLVNNQPVTSIIDPEEFQKLRSEIRELEKAKDPKKDDDDGTTNETDENILSEENMTAIRDKIIAVRRKIHKTTVAAVTARWTFEEGIKRPYFHVKPLERCQLKNWKDYIDFEIEKGDQKRILILFERCLIACALYDEFWLKLIRYLEAQNDPKLIPITRDAFERACKIHHPDKPSIHLLWSAFEECHNDFDKAAIILNNLEKLCPNLLQVSYRRINLERRRGDYNKCKELYEHYITNAKNKNIAGSLSIKYARFCHKIMGDLESGYNILKLALEKDPSNTRVALQMIDMALQRERVNEDEIVEIMDKFMARESMEPEQKVLFAQRKVEFLEDFGSTSKGLQEAQRLLQIALAKANEAKKKSESSPSKKTTKETTVAPPTNSSSNNYNSNNYTAYGSNTGAAATSSGYYGANNQSYPSYDGYSYNHWQQYGSGYTGYNSSGQWSGYGNYY